MINYILINYLPLAADVETADKAIDTIDKLGKAGPTTLALAVAVAAIAFAVWTLKSNYKLREAHAKELRNRELTTKKEAELRLDKAMLSEAARRDAEKQMLKEMIEHGHEAIQALEQSSEAIQEITKALQGLERKIEDLIRDLESIRRRQV